MIHILKQYISAMFIAQIYEPYTHIYIYISTLLMPHILMVMCIYNYIHNMQESVSLLPIMTLYFLGPDVAGEVWRGRWLARWLRRLGDINVIAIVFLGGKTGTGRQRDINVIVTGRRRRRRRRRERGIGNQRSATS